MGKLRIEHENVYIEADTHGAPLVQFKDLKDASLQDEPTQGTIRAYMWSWPDGLVLQFRAKTSLTDRSQPKNLIATSHVSLQHLEQIVAYFKALRSAPIEPICENCKHWRHKVTSTDDKSWGKCDNEQNETYVMASALVKTFVPEEETWAREEILDGIRYPGTFGCRFFELQPNGDGAGDKL